MEDGPVSLTTVSKERFSDKLPRQIALKRTLFWTANSCVLGKSWQEPLPAAMVPNSSSHQTGISAERRCLVQCDLCYVPQLMLTGGTGLTRFSHVPDICHHFGQKQEPLSWNGICSGYRRLHPLGTSGHISSHLHALLLCLLFWVPAYLSASLLSVLALTLALVVPSLKMSEPWGWKLKHFTQQARLW